ncbi:HDOD domain-containing protein [Rhodothermus bifroesti]|uniref:HDOD domain-containing protein n=1 Tax=Rhodothermus bifroesti TaxID=2823335 RepID=UPI001AEFDF14|nr:HDOD domain-containing protein [Rhodothermus bifroesti]
MSTARPTLSRLELRCPPLPQTLTEAVGLLNQPDQLEVRAVTRLVERDPVVVARLLQIVNSAYYGLRRTVSSVERAVVLLGPVSVAGIIIGMQMLRLRAALPSQTLACFHRLSQHSLATAFLARHLLGLMHPRASNQLSIGFTAGLLHDFGKIILVYNFPDEAVAFYDQQRLTQTVQARDEQELERLLFGFDHTEAGEYVAHKLNFPDVLIDTIRFHHAPDQTPPSREAYWLTPAIAVADRIARTMGYAFTHPLHPDEALNHPAWALLLDQYQAVEWTPESLLTHCMQQQEYLGQHVQSLSLPNPPTRTRP